MLTRKRYICLINEQIVISIVNNDICKDGGLTHLLLDIMAAIALTFRCIFVNENFYILIKISLKCVNKCQVHNNTELVKIMPWRRIGDKPLSEPMLTRFSLTHICGTRGRWVNCEDIPTYQDTLAAFDSKCSAQVHDNWSVHFCPQIG